MFAEWEERTMIHAIGYQSGISDQSGISRVRSRIFHHFDDYTEVWGAIVFGILAIMSCAAMAWACNGIL